MLAPSRSCMAGDLERPMPRPRRPTRQSGGRMARPAPGLEATAARTCCPTVDVTNPSRSAAFPVDRGVCSLVIPRADQIMPVADHDKMYELVSLVNGSAAARGTVTEMATSKAVRTKAGRNAPARTQDPEGT